MASRDRRLKRGQKMRLKQPRIFCHTNRCKESIPVEKLNPVRDAGFQKKWFLAKNYSPAWCPEHVPPFIRQR